MESWEFTAETSESDYGLNDSPAGLSETLRPFSLSRGQRELILINDRCLTYIKSSDFHNGLMAMFTPIFPRRKAEKALLLSPGYAPSNGARVTMQTCPT